MACLSCDLNSHFRNVINFESCHPCPTIAAQNITRQYSEREGKINRRPAVKITGMVTHHNDGRKKDHVKIAK
jgi:hypothetical protein